MSPLYFLKIQNSFLHFVRRPKSSLTNAVYFWFSLVFLIIRTTAFLLCSTSIHDESKNPIKVLRGVTRYSWCTEVERFIEEVVHGTISLTGMRFFFLTRKLILSVSNHTEDAFMNILKRKIQVPCFDLGCWNYCYL